MNVWIVNLLDNRAEEDKPKDLQKSKFQFCKGRGIIGIGWVGSDPENSEDIGFLRAHNAISAFRKDDLVWTKDPDSKEYYICRVTGEALSASDAELNQHDISKFCPCEFIAVGEEEKLPSGILKDDLISRTAISKANPTVSKITQAYVNTLTSPVPPVLQTPTPHAQPIGNQPTQEKKKPTLKKIVCIAAVALLILLTVILISTSVYKKMYPVIPYDNIKLGDTLADVKEKASYTSEEFLGEENESISLTEDLSARGVTNTEYFYPRLHIPFTAGSTRNTIHYLFDAGSEQLVGVMIHFDCPFPDSRIYEVIDYYETALGTNDHTLKTKQSEGMGTTTRTYTAEIQEDGYRVYITCVTIDLPDLQYYANSGSFVICIEKDNAATK